jgi:hypothetical protein
MARGVHDADRGARGLLEQREGLHQLGGAAEAGGPAGEMESEHVFVS